MEPYRHFTIASYMFTYYAAKASEKENRRAVGICFRRACRARKKRISGDPEMICRIKRGCRVHPFLVLCSCMFRFPRDPAAYIVQTECV